MEADGFLSLLPVFWSSSGLILLSRERLEARDSVCLRGCRAQAVLLRCGWKAQVSGLSSVPGDDLGLYALGSPGLYGPSMGGMFDRGVPCSQTDLDSCFRRK